MVPATSTTLASKILSCVGRDLLQQLFQIDKSMFPKILHNPVQVTGYDVQNILGCNENQEPTLLTIARKKKVATWSECRDFCDKNSECEYFQWKVCSS